MWAVSAFVQSVGSSTVLDGTMRLCVAGGISARMNVVESMWTNFKWENA